MKKMIFFVLVNVVMLNNAFAAWEIIATAPDGKLHAYIDDKRISRNKTIVTYWQKEDKPDGGDIKVKAEINCKTMQRREHDSYEYDEKGDVIKKYTDTTRWEDIVPDSVNELIYRRLCK